MLKPRCPHCNAKISIFSGAWRKQWESSKKSCTHCGKPVELMFSEGKYWLMVLPVIAASVLAYNWFGWLTAGLLFVAAFALPLVPNLRLLNADRKIHFTA